MAEEDTSVVEQEEFSLRKSQYFRAEALGEGGYGSVRTVYDGDGNCFAVKDFVDDEDEAVADDDDDEDVDDEDYEPRGGDGTVSLGVLREVSALRMFSKITEDDEFQPHPYIMALHDVVFMDEQWSMVMPRLDFSLEDAMKGGCLGNKTKLLVAHRLIAAVCFLHQNGLMHRDIKPSNVLLSRDALDTPVLADFSLAKPFDISADALPFDAKAEPTHSPEVYTAGYRAPEIVAKTRYGTKAETWALGVVCLEMFDGCLPTDRDKRVQAALNHIAAKTQKMSDAKPLPALLRSMLEVQQESRVSVKAALSSPAFSTLSLPSALVQPREAVVAVTQGDAATTSKENQHPAKRARGSKAKGGGDKLARLAEVIGVQNPKSIAVAERYLRLSPDLAPINALVLAAKLYEIEALDVMGVEDLVSDFDLDTYVEEEKRMFQVASFQLF